jgi:hypothetical protein
MHRPARSAVTIMTELLQLLPNMVKAITDWLLTTQHNFHVIYDLNLYCQNKFNWVLWDVCVSCLQDKFEGCL